MENGSVRFRGIEVFPAPMQKVRWFLISNSYASCIYVPVSSWPELLLQLFATGEDGKAGEKNTVLCKKARTISGHPSCMAPCSEIARQWRHRSPIDRRRREVSAR